MRRYVPLDFNRTHEIGLTISVITAGQLNVNIKQLNSDVDSNASC